MHWTWDLQYESMCSTTKLYSPLECSLELHIHAPILNIYFAVAIQITETCKTKHNSNWLTGWHSSSSPVQECCNCKCALKHISIFSRADTESCARSMPGPVMSVGGQGGVVPGLGVGEGGRRVEQGHFWAGKAIWEMDWAWKGVGALFIFFIT